MAYGYDSMPSSHTWKKTGVTHLHILAMGNFCSKFIHNLYCSYCLGRRKDFSSQIRSIVQFTNTIDFKHPDPVTLPTASNVLIQDIRFGVYDLHYKL